MPTVTALTGGGNVLAWQNTDVNDTDVELQSTMPQLASSDTVQMVQGAHGSVVQKAGDTLS